MRIISNFGKTIKRGGDVPVATKVAPTLDQQGSGAKCVIQA